MDIITIAEAASLLGVSDDTVRRLVDAGTLPHSRDTSGRKVIPGDALAHYAASKPAAPDETFGGRVSARNRLVGLVTEVKVDEVMGQVELRCGPFTITSLISADSVREMGLEPGSVAVAVIKSTNVIIETQEAPR
ncbi:TOBE domain-containing protein [Brooklawnia cerclae]|uniref:Molybdopterin-binding protein n=1 Tax=Brooklawnia cerclae TaxID=349934 RepID=A0ABX0SC78_9ACTN|nr:helix-turn-helix domain-containing protein [Brooklawnia cerclae]NIH55993.1 molybdopterin-binding protein [Brooklawnia cerclae]